MCVQPFEQEWASIKNNDLMINEEIIQGCVKNESAAQEILYKHFAGKMMSICLRYASSTDEAEDIMQEGFVKVFEKINLYKNKGSLEGWVRKVMINTALDILRRDKKHQYNVDIDSADYKMPHYDNTIDKISANEIIKLVQSMPVGFRTVFNLYAIEGYTHREIGEKLGISKNTSKSQYSRARNYLKELMYKNKILVDSE